MYLINDHMVAYWARAMDTWTDRQGIMNFDMMVPGLEIEELF